MENNQFRAHQSAANDAITAELESADRCLVKMFCGTGKSLVMRNCDVVKHKNLAVYVLPSLALISQFRHDYLGSVPNANKLFICSEDREPDIQITTDHTLIQQFVKCSGDKVICVTYDSLGTLFANLSGVRIDIIVYDEAHHTVEQNNYERIYNESNMYCDKHVFFTATPNNNNGIVMFDRDSDKAADCGKCVFEYTYLDGVRDGIINPFEIRVDVSSRFQGNDVDRVYESIARTILTTGNSRVLTFHSGVNGDDDTSVKNFVNRDAFMAAFNRVISEEFPEKTGQYKNIHMFGLYAGLDKQIRESILKDGLDVSPDNEIYIVSSCMTIGEGVDTKNANMCVFVDPKKSHVNIIQNIGRVLRKQAGCSTVLIPCLVNKDDYVDCGEDAEKRDDVIRNDMKTGGDFSSILNVMAALRQEDPDLYDMCLNVGDESDDDDNEIEHDNEEDSDSAEDSDSDGEYSGEDKDVRSCKITVNMSSVLSILWNISSADFSREVCNVVLECNVKYDPMETAIGIVERANEREVKGLNILPNKNTKTCNNIQEHKDAIKLSCWKMALKHNKYRYRWKCSDAVRDYLDEKLRGWRDFIEFEQKAMNAALEIIERAKTRENNGGKLLPRHFNTKKLCILSESENESEKKERKDYTKLSGWREAIQVNISGGGKNIYCYDSVRDLLDNRLPGWRCEFDRLKRAEEIVKRANERFENRGLLLPRNIYKKENRNTPELEQEKKDATTLGNWKKSIKNNNIVSCPIEVIQYLDEKLHGWRDKSDYESIALQHAKDIVQRAKERNNGIAIPPVRHATETNELLIQETKDANLIGNWKMTYYQTNKKSLTTYDSVNTYLDANLPGWRDEIHSDENKLLKAKEIVQRTIERQQNGGKLFPRNIEKSKRITKELEQEAKDAQDIQCWKRACNVSLVNVNWVCPDNVKQYLDDYLPGWRTNQSVKAMKDAEDIVKRALIRQQTENKLLPRDMLNSGKKKDLLTSIENQEHNDNQKLSRWRNALVGNGTTTCSDELREYLDINLSGWRPTETRDAERMKQANCIFERAMQRRIAGIYLLPKQKTNPSNPEEEQEKKDIQTLRDWRDIKHKLNSELLSYLDLNLPGWYVKNNVVENAMKTATEIVERANKRKHKGLNVLPRETDKRDTPENEQEYKDACKIGRWRRAFDGKLNGIAVCPDEVCKYLDENLPGWRPIPVVEKDLTVSNKIIICVPKKKSHLIPNNTNTPSIACAPNHNARAKSEYQRIGHRWATQTSNNTHEQLQSNPAEWHAYHAARDISFQGYDPDQIPRNRIIACMEKRYKSYKMRVLDMGCGRGNIYQHFDQTKNHKLTIIGYDHVAEEGKNIRVGNINDLSGEEEDESADVCIYSQSLMGADKLKYLDEGYRILHFGGEFIISESYSMLDAVKAKLTELGCKIDTEENTVNEDTDEQYRWFLLVAIKR